MLQNSADFTGLELNVIFREESLQNITPDLVIKGINTDSRKIEQGNMFVALKGEKIDGHEKITDAVNAGAVCIMAEKSWYERAAEDIRKLPAIIVDSSLEGIGKLANFHRRRFDYPIIAIAGSNGKTTTKEFTAHLLSQKFNVHKTYSNYNNRLGVPLVLLQLDKSFDAAVIEIGTSEPGEISILSEILAPTHGVITNIHEEHLENLIDLLGVELEETYLYGYLRRKEGLAFINMADERLSKYSTLMEKKFTYGNQNSTMKSEIIESDSLVQTIRIEYDDRIIEAKLSAAGTIFALNALPATAIALELGLTDEQIQKGLESFRPDEKADYGRMLIEESGGIKIINDCYNANPASMRSALDTLNNYPVKGRKTAILADMLEMGESSGRLHSEILDYATGKADKIFLFGIEMEKAAGEKKYDNIEHYDNKDKIVDEIISNLSSGDIILVKGSREMKMEEIVNNLKKALV